jgi:REP element-mobilizing transposase RayT
MPVRREIPYKQGIYFITVTCYRWLPLIELSNGYDIVYKWFDYLKTKNHFVAGYVIMPNHLHVLISFDRTEKSINKIIGDGKRFIAYEIVTRLERNGNIELIKELQKAVEDNDKKRGKKHEIWKDSFDWKFCETEKFVNQKLSYIHNNPCSGKWKLAESPIHYNHSSAKFYISGKHAAFEVKNVEELFKENLNLSAESLPTGRHG